MGEEALSTSAPVDSATQLKYGINRYVGQCIYCTASSLDLQDEHVVPYGLLPRACEPLVLKEASCPACAKVTSAFERSVLRNLWPAARAFFKLRSYRKRDKDVMLPLDITRDGKEERVMLRAAEFPVVINFLIFAPPACFDGRPYERGIDVVGTAAVGYGPKPQDVAKALGASSFKHSVTFEKDTFQRLLLKIAFGCAVGTHGRDAFSEVYVLDAIMGRADNSGLWLGCDNQTMLSSSTFHGGATVVHNSREVTVRVRLFPPPAPEYVAAVGRLAPTPS
jgi:hypothetical protein